MRSSPLIVLTCVAAIGICSGATPRAGAARAAAAGTAVTPPNHSLATCAACHGAAGQGQASMPTTPYLAGLPAAYLQRQLRALAAGTRQGGPMTALARGLSSAARRAAATRFAALPRPVAAVQRLASQPPALGRRLAEHGRWSRGVPACVLCHGRGGLGVGSAFPPLAGQPAAYLTAQLHAFQQGTRPPGPLGLMKVIAAKLSEADMRAVSEYFSSLPPAIGRRAVR